MADSSWSSKPSEGNLVLVMLKVDIGTVGEGRLETRSVIRSLAVIWGNIGPRIGLKLEDTGMLASCSLLVTSIQLHVPL